MFKNMYKGLSLPVEQAGVIVALLTKSQIGIVG